ncbi:CaiB/BaiF CoA transferase family protein [Streptomyces sp. NPDC004393]
MSEKQHNGNGGPLAGLRVVELGTVVMAPYAAQQLGDLGADVIKVEHPDGDVSRRWTPQRHPGMGAANLNLNRNKRSVVLNLKESRDRAAFLALAATADVFITNVRPDALRRLGVDYERLSVANPRLVFVTAQGFRVDSSQGDRAAYDDTVQAATGLLALNQQVSGEPRFVPTLLVDKLCGLVIVQAVLAALRERDNLSGIGQHVEVPMVDTMLSFNLVEHLWAATLEPHGEFGYRRALSPRREATPTSDGWMVIMPYTDRNWRDFAAAVGRPELADDPRFSSLKARTANADEFYDLIASLTPLHTTSEWQELCDAKSIPASPVHTLAEATSTEYAKEGGILQDAVHPTEGPYRLIGHPVRYSRTPAALYRHSPNLGENTREVLAKLGFDPAEPEEAAATKV